MMSETPTPLIDRLDAVLFDFDGTLADTIAHILSSFQHATKEVLGASPTDEELLFHVGIPLLEQMRLLADDEDTAQRLLTTYRAYNRTTHDAMVRLYPGTLEVLNAIHDRCVPMGVVTSKGTPMAMKGIGLFDLGRFLSVIVTADDVSLHKPDPFPVVHAAAMLEVDPSRVAYVGDSPADVASALGAGAVAIAATWGVASRERLQAAHPHYILDDIRDLPPLLFGSDRQE
ncbi:MAG: HAD family hydrolase [Coriobacteriia bacterium]